MRAGKCTVCETELRAIQLPTESKALYVAKHQFLAWYLRRGIVQLSWNDFLQLDYKDTAVIRIIIEEMDRIEAEAQKKAMDG